MVAELLVVVEPSGELRLPGAVIIGREKVGAGVVHVAAVGLNL